MANEASVLQGGVGSENIVETYSITAGATIPVGSFMVANATSGAAQTHTAGSIKIPLGYAVESSTSTDLDTVIGVQTGGDVLAFIDGSVTTGDVVCLSETTANRLRRLCITGTLSYTEIQSIVGRAKATGTDGQKIRIKLTLANG